MKTKAQRREELARMMEKKPEVSSLPSMTNAGARRELLESEYLQGWIQGKQGKMINPYSSDETHRGWEAGRASRREELNISIRRVPLHKPRLWEPGEIEAELKKRQEADEAKHQRWQASALRAEIVDACVA